MHHWFLEGSVIPFSTISELEVLLNAMSAEDYALRTESVDLNYYRAQAWTGLENGILLHSDVMSALPVEFTSCAGTCGDSAVGVPGIVE